VAQADVNEALMLLMRYPSPSQPHGPRTLVLDAIYLKSHCNYEGGTEIVVKYSNRAPPQFKRVAPRPATPDSYTGTPTSSRARSPFGSPAPRALDALLGDAARGVLTRGEKWGFNLRDAVGEVRKNVQGLQAGQPSPRLGPSHRTTKSEISNNIAASVLRKMTALEDRNRRLAAMLETAVADLWRIEKEIAEKKEVEGQSDALSIAVAKVQFVQVFLQDSALPLPPEDPAEHNGSSKEAPKAEEPVVSAPDDAQQSVPVPPPEDKSHSPIISISPPRRVTIPLASSPPMAMTTRTSTQTSSLSLPTTSLSTETASRTATSGLPAKQSRPRLDQSSFSWMLGQAHEHRKSFIDPSPLSPAERRFHAAHGGEDKGFLFGEDDDVPGETKKPDKTKSKDKRNNSVTTRAREDIGLGDMGSSS
jgi:TBC1 domain family protein 5